MENTNYVECKITKKQKEDLEWYISRDERTMDRLKAEIKEVDERIRRNRKALKTINEEEYEFLKTEFFEKVGLSEQEDCRGTFIIFNERLEYVETIRLKEFINKVSNTEDTLNFNDKLDCLKNYLRENKLYAQSADGFIGKSLKWYKKSFKEKLTSLSWRLDENGTIMDVEW